jgi:hypothetical protein
MSDFDPIEYAKSFKPDAAPAQQQQQEGQQKFVSALIEFLKAGTANIESLKVAGDVDVVGTVTAASIIGPLVEPAWLPYPAGTYVFPSGNQVVAAGVLPIGASTTAPTFGTGTVMKGYYRDHGKTIDLRLSVTQTSTTAAAAGSGCYYLPMPLGKLIDTSIVSLSTNDVSNLGRFDGQILGSGKLTATPYFGVTWLTGFSTILLECMLNYVNIGSGGSNGGQWGTTGNASFTPNSYAQLHASWECFGIPIV